MSLVQRLLEDGFTPFAFGAPSNLAQLDPMPLGVELRMLPADAPEYSHFHHLINAINGVAYGSKDMAMPAWVQQDCGVLPSAFIGWACPARRLESRLLWELGLHGDEALVPVSEAISIPSATPGQWVSFSMCSVMSGHRLGLASKLVSLAAYGASSTLGVAQYDNYSLKMHTLFGPLELVEPFVPYHTIPDRTFTYRLAGIDEAMLARVDAGVRPPITEPSFLLDADDAATMEEMAEATRAGEARFHLLAPGVIRREGRVLAPILRSSAHP